MGSNVVMFEVMVLLLGCGSGGSGDDSGGGVVGDSGCMYYCWSQIIYLTLTIKLVNL